MCILMFCLSRWKLLGPVLYPLGTTSLPDGEGPEHPEQNTTAPRSPSYPRPLCCWSNQSHPSPFTPSPTTGVSMAGQAAAGGPASPSAQVELGLQPPVAGWDAKLPGFILQGFQILPVHVSRPPTRGGERKPCSWRTQHLMNGKPQSCEGVSISARMST